MTNPVVQKVESTVVTWFKANWHLLLAGAALGVGGYWAFLKWL